MKILFVAFFLLALGVNASAQNPIVGENQLPGTPQSTWDLGGPGSASIEGFTTDISVNHGSTATSRSKLPRPLGLLPGQWRPADHDDQ